jgi:predicted acyltransferase (DUF342 family)
MELTVGHCRSIQSSSQVSLQHNIHVEGKVNASNDISILHDVFVTGNVECRTKVVLSDGVNVVGKVIGRYGIEFSTLSTIIIDSFDASSNNRREVPVGGNVKSRP